MILGISFGDRREHSELFHMVIWRSLAEARIARRLTASPSRPAMALAGIMIKRDGVQDLREDDERS